MCLVGVYFRPVLQLEFRENNYTCARVCIVNRISPWNCHPGYLRILSFTKPMEWNKKKLVLNIITSLIITNHQLPG